MVRYDYNISDKELFQEFVSNLVNNFDEKKNNIINMDELGSMQILLDIYNKKLKFNSEN